MCVDPSEILIDAPILRANMVSIQQEHILVLGELHSGDNNEQGNSIFIDPDGNSENNEYIYKSSSMLSVTATTIEAIMMLM